MDKPLLPKIARIAKDQAISYERLAGVERQMLERLRRESVPFLSGIQPETDWDWLSVARHQGLPTRLLDWSASALVGLWFAVAEDPPAKRGAGVLWVLEVEPANEKTPSSKEDVFGLRRTYVFQPFHIDRRIVAQSSWFSVHMYAERSARFIPLDQNDKYKRFLRRYEVPRSAFEPLRKELRVMGVTQATVFPDLSGLCAEIQADCLGALRSPEMI